MNLTKAQRFALSLLARGGARYGTRIDVMKELKDMGLCYAHSRPKRPGEFRCRQRTHTWTWRPTDAGRRVIAELAAHTAKETA